MGLLSKEGHYHVQDLQDVLREYEQALFPSSVFAILHASLAVILTDCRLAYICNADTITA
jgi:hypothetical protein